MVSGALPPPLHPLVTLQFPITQACRKTPMCEIAQQAKSWLDCRRIVEEELPLYTCTKGYDTQLPASSSGNQTRSYNELATLMYVTGKQWRTCNFLIVAVTVTVSVTVTVTASVTVAMTHACGAGELAVCASIC